MKTLEQWQKEYEQAWEDASYPEWTDSSLIWKFIEGMAKQMLLEVQPDNMRQDAEALYKIGYLEAQRNVQLKKEIILGETGGQNEKAK